MFRYVHHVHYAVKNLDAAMAYLEKNFDMKPDRVEVGKSNNPANEAIYHAGLTEIQVTEPTTTTSALAKHLEKYGPGIYHIAWAVEDIETLHKRVVALGNEMRREGVDSSPRGYKTVNIEPSEISEGLAFQLIENFDPNS